MIVARLLLIIATANLVFLFAELGVNVFKSAF